MSSERKLLDLKERMKQASDRTKEGEGALKQLLKDLKSQFGYTSLEEGSSELAKLGLKLEKREERLKTSTTKFARKYENALEVTDE